MDALRVLVVDDEFGMRAGTARVLERLKFRPSEMDSHEVGFQVEQADSGETALQQIAARLPDIILLDYKLPGISGLDVLSQLSSISPESLAVMITAYATLETAVVATKRGAFDFLAKPFTPEELRATVLKASKHIVLQRQAKLHAEEKKRIRFEFISVLAHELKAPLSAVEGYLLAMQDRSLGDDLQAYGTMIDRSVIRLAGMRKLVVDLLDLTRIESGQRKRENEKLDVLEVARHVFETVKGEADAKRITLQIHHSGPVTMMGDRAEIEVVLANLFTNAVKYNRDGGSADLILEERDGLITMQMKDTGIGMTAEEVSRVFKEFVRIKNEKTMHIPGSGLGLSTVKKVAALYNGDAKITSQPDVGTTVEITLMSNKA